MSVFYVAFHLIIPELCCTFPSGWIADLSTDARYFNEDVLFSICNLSYNSFGRDVLQGRNVQQFMDDMFREDPWEEVRWRLRPPPGYLTRRPATRQLLARLMSCNSWFSACFASSQVADNLMMVSFASFRLRGVGMGMNYPIACVNWWGPLAEQVRSADAWRMSTVPPQLAQPHASPSWTLRRRSWSRRVFHTTRGLRRSLWSTSPMNWRVASPQQRDDSHLSLATSSRNYPEEDIE